MSNKAAKNKQQIKQDINKKDQKSNVKYNSNKRHTYQEEQKTRYYLIPIFVILCFIPLLVQYRSYNVNMAKYAWFSSQDNVADFFLFYKQRWFLFISAIVACVVAIKVLYKRKALPFSKIFIPLSAYAIMTLLSAVFSKYKYYCFHGSFDMFESVYVVLGYCLIVYYIFLFVDTEQDFKKIQYYLVGFALLMGILGTFQYLGYDFFATQLGKNIMIPSQFRKSVGINMVFGVKRVYLTLYNPDYVGVYTALVTPIIAVLMLFQKKVVPIILMGIAVIGLIISAIGSKSLSGILGLGTALVVVAIFMWRYLLKRIYITIPAVIIVIIGLLFINSYTNNYFIDKFKNTLNAKKTVYALTDMHTEDDGISLTYNGNVMKVHSIVGDNQILTLQAVDSNKNPISSTYDAATCKSTITDVRFSGITYGWNLQASGQFYITVDGLTYNFTNLANDGKYYYINAYGRMDKMIMAPSAVFTGYETLASNRGYIWSRTIPLLKNYILLGSGSDTYTLVYPQEDYMNMVRYGFSGSVLTKPHSMYLQMAVQTGVISLIAFLIFYGMYFVSSIQLYIRGRYTNFYSKMGVAVFIGTFCYMVTGLANDSSLCTAPIFWTLMGVGITLNYKAKPLIMKEIAYNKAEKEKQKQAKVAE